MEKVYYIAIQGSHWGRGDSEKQAKANMRRAGGKGKSTAYMVRQTEDKPPPHVDVMGVVVHFGKNLEWVSGKDVLGCKPVPLVQRAVRDPWGGIVRMQTVQPGDAPQCACTVCRRARGEYVEEWDSEEDDAFSDDEDDDDL